jgi:hypothetical protein
MPSISRRAVQGVLVRFFRNGDGHHSGMQIAINELELKSWEAFLNYLNRQPRLTLASGGIQHVYSINGGEIRSMTKLQHRQSYVVASGAFIKTTYQHMNDAFNDEPETSTQSSLTSKRWRSPPTANEQIFIVPYTRLNAYESMIFNRHYISTFDEWLHEHVTDLLTRFIGSQTVTHLYAFTKTTFTEVCVQITRRTVSLDLLVHR